MYSRINYLSLYKVFLPRLILVVPRKYPCLIKSFSKNTLWALFGFFRQSVGTLAETISLTAVTTNLFFIILLQFFYIYQCSIPSIILHLSDYILRV